MNLHGPSKLLRIFTGENDKVENGLLYEKILFLAREQGLAGGTVIKGIMSYGASSHVHRARLIESAPGEKVYCFFLLKHKKFLLKSILKYSLKMFPMEKYSDKIH